MSEFRMRPQYKTLLCGTRHLGIGIFQLYKVTAEQLTRLHYSPASLKFIKKNLKTLVDEGYAQVGAYAVEHDTPQRITFSAQYFYTLAPAGVKYMAGLGYDVDESWKPHNNNDPHALYVPHTLEINDVIIAGALLSGADPRPRLESFTHESVYKRHPIQVRLGGRTENLMPDAYLIFHRVSTSKRMAVFLEHDRDTESEPSFKRKIQAYLSFINDKGYEQLLDSDNLSVIFTTFNGEDRLQKMRRYTRQVLVAANAPAQVHDVFRFATLPKPLSPEAAWLEPRWYYPEDDQPQPLLAA